MAEMPNVVSYVIIMALVVSGVSFFFGWQPSLTALTIADVRTCDVVKCNSYDLFFCMKSELHASNYECVENECRLVNNELVSYCDIACIEPEFGDAYCAIRRFN